MESESETRAIPLIERIVDACPNRLPGSRSERRAQRMLRREFASLDLQTGFHRFRFNRSIYANFALHFGLAAIGSVLFVQSPLAALAVHALVVISYLGDTSRRFYLLRRLFPFHQSQNLVARRPAENPPRLHIVLVAHADAAYTGEIFEPERLRTASRMPPLPFDLARKPIRLAVASVLALGAIDCTAFWWGASPWLWIGLVLATLPPLLVAFANLEVVARNEVVPGANDNLTGCAGLVLLAERLERHRPEDVELTFVATGAEEAGGGGGRALAREKLACGDWRPDNTVVIGVDGLSNGRLRYFREAEVFRTPIPTFLLDVLEDTKAEDERFAELERHDIHAGSTDVLAFRAAGFPGVCLGCVDPEFGAPRHYHHPSDTPENLDSDQFARSLDFTERFVRRLMNRRR